MAARIVDLYPLSAPVEILLDKKWVAGRVARHDYPAVWVEIANGSSWFVTNGRRIRKRDEKLEDG
jgi:hypothetical protein